MPRAPKQESNGTPRPKLASKTNDKLTHYVERLEKMEMEKRELAQSMKEVLQAADDEGYTRKALKAIVNRRLESPEQEEKRERFETDFDDYCARLGMLAGTPLGDAAIHATQHPN